MRGRGLLRQIPEARLALALLALMIAGCAPPDDSALACTATFPNCHLKDGGRLRGVALGMSPQATFGEACSGQLSRSLSNPLYTTYSSTVTPHNFADDHSRQGSVLCEDEAFAVSHDFWMFDSNLGVCWFPRHERTSMQFTDGRLSRVEIDCGVIDF